MNAIYEALYDKVNDTPNSFYTSIGGRYYSEKAPQRVTFPYCVGHIITIVPNDTFEEWLDKIDIQFSIYSNDGCSSIELGNIYEYLKTLFDNKLLTVSGHVHYNMDRTFANPRWIPGEEVWQYIVGYTMTIEKNRV